MGNKGLIFESSFCLISFIGNNVSTNAMSPFSGQHHSLLIWHTVEAGFSLFMHNGCSCLPILGPNVNIQRTLVNSLAMKLMKKIRCLEQKQLELCRKFQGEIYKVQQTHVTFWLKVTITTSCLHESLSFQSIIFPFPKLIFLETIKWCPESAKDSSPWSSLQYRYRQGQVLHLSSCWLPSAISIAKLANLEKADSVGAEI